MPGGGLAPESMGYAGMVDKGYMGFIGIISTDYRGHVGLCRVLFVSC